jgi:hypothetical protein
MALDHIVATPTTTKSVLFTIPAGIYNAHVTIQNRGQYAIAIGDDTLGLISSVDAGIILPAGTGGVPTAGGTFQTFMNAGDVIYVIAATNFTLTTDKVVVLISYGRTLTPNAQ